MNKEFKTGFLPVVLIGVVSVLLLLAGCASASVTPGVFVEIGKERTGYDTLEQAFASVPDGTDAVIYVSRDMVLTGQINVPRSNITLTDDGHGITVSRSFSDSKANRMFVVTGKAILTIVGSKNGSVTIDARPESGADMENRQVFLVGDPAVLANQNNGTLYLNSGVTIVNNTTSADGAVALCYGKVTVNGALISNNSTSGRGGAFAVDGKGDFRIYSGTVSGNSSGTGGALAVLGQASAVLNGGSLSSNKASLYGGNVYIGGANQSVLIGGKQVDLSGGVQADGANDICIGNGTGEQPTRVSFTGRFIAGAIELLGPEIRFKITSELTESTVHVRSAVPIEKEHLFAMIEGVHAADQYGTFKFDGLPGSMFSDTDALNIRFFATPIEQKEWGDCTYIEFPDGTNMIIDAGQTESGQAIARLLWETGIEKIDVMILTHYHSDHANGLKAIIEEAKIKVGRFVSSSYMPSNSYSWVPSDLKQYGIEKVVVAAGDSFDAGGAHFDVLWPEAGQLEPVPKSTQTDPGGAYTDSNPPPLGGTVDMNSKTLVIKMTYGQNSVLFTGDIYANRIAYKGSQDWDYTAFDNKNSDEYLVLRYQGTDTLKSDIMTAPHHGKRTSSSDLLVRAVSPSYAVAMGGNFHSDIALRYEDNGAVFYLTGSTARAYKGAQNADVYVRMDGQTYTVRVGE